MPNEADTCRTDVVPRLQAAGWDDEPHSIAEQRTITDGRIVPIGKGFIRRAPKRVDYLLRYTRDFPLAVVEAKAAYRSAFDGLQQAKQYAEMLGLKFAYATNGKEIVEFDYRNPHSWVRVVGKSDTSAGQEFAAEWASPVRLKQWGVTETTLKPGDRVLITGSPGRDPGEHRIHLKSIQRPADGWRWAGPSSPR